MGVDPSGRRLRTCFQETYYVGGNVVGRTNTITWHCSSVDVNGSLGTTPMNSMMWILTCVLLGLIGQLHADMQSGESPVPVRLLHSAALPPWDFAQNLAATTVPAGVVLDDVDMPQRARMTPQSSVTGTTTLSEVLAVFNRQHPGYQAVRGRRGSDSTDERSARVSRQPRSNDDPGARSFGCATEAVCAGRPSSRSARRVNRSWFGWRC